MNLKNINLSEKKPCLKDYMLFIYIYMKLKKKTYYSTNKIKGAILGIEDWLQRGKKYILGVMKIFCILSWYLHDLIHLPKLVNYTL